MSTATATSPIQREPELLGQTVVGMGGSAGIGLEAARRARAEGAKLILTGRNPERLQRAASELDVLTTAAFDATDPSALDRFFQDQPATIDHVMVRAGSPYYAPLATLAPIRVNLIAAGFVDTPLSASLLGDELENRRNQLRATLPIRRVVGPADVAALAVHIMINTALTGATYDIDGGQQLVAS
jgi:NAD(P)-dependent dehydrogenase (short-subunit alcohol dehydrogenase family)